MCFNLEYKIKSGSFRMSEYFTKLTAALNAAFRFRVFHTHVYARKTLNPSTLYIF